MRVGRPMYVSCHYNLRYAGSKFSNLIHSKTITYNVWVLRRLLHGHLLLTYFDLLVQVWKSESKLIRIRGHSASASNRDICSSTGSKLQKDTLPYGMGHSCRHRANVQGAVSGFVNSNKRILIKHSGIQPHEAAASGQISPYTVPAIQMMDGTYVMDSAAIASELEGLHPNPSLHLDNGFPAKLGPILGKAAGPLVPVFMPRIGRDMIVDESYDWFQEARGKRFGMPLDDLEKSKGGDQAWEAARPGIIELKEFVGAHKQDDGPFILGSKVCYADFLVASMMEALRRIGDDLYESLVKVAGDDSLRQLHEACQQWMRDDQ